AAFVFCNSYSAKTPYLAAHIAMSAHRYFIVNKPSNMLSQFIGSDLPGLSDINFSFPEHIHAIGRLDRQSEGLLILTTNKKVTKLL
ncbi:pseudouridine synthase, partial [Escherichia coli]|nr:pseudouridine synthase [Escherichia coli]